VVEALDAFVIADPMTDAALPDAPRIDATMDAFSPPDAATSGRCLDPRAELTSEGCAIPSATACTPFSPCPTGYSCTATAMGDRCRCDDRVEAHRSDKQLCFLCRARRRRMRPHSRGTRWTLRGTRRWDMPHCYQCRPRPRHMRLPMRDMSCLHL
jgi:hypothetical protein